jgi:hypothetical protein
VSYDGTKFAVIALVAVTRNGENALQTLAKDYLLIGHKLTKRGLRKEESGVLVPKNPSPELCLC